MNAFQADLLFYVAKMHTTFKPLTKVRIKLAEPAGITGRMVRHELFTYGLESLQNDETDKKKKLCL